MPGKASANALTSDGISDLGGGGDFQDARVQVTPPSNQRQRMLIRAVSLALSQWIPPNDAATRKCDTVLVCLIMCCRLKERGRNSGRCPVPALFPFTRRSLL